CRRPWPLGGQLASPTEPHAAGMAQSRQNTDRKSAGCRTTLGHSHTIRHADDAGHNVSSHVRLSLIAALMIPTRAMRFDSTNGRSSRMLVIAASVVSLSVSLLP